MLQIKLTGPVECRLGMLLLTSPNVTVLGGEVESLMTTNNQKCVLSHAMYVSIHHMYNEMDYTLVSIMLCLWSPYSHCTGIHTKLTFFLKAFQTHFLREHPLFSTFVQEYREYTRREGVNPVVHF